MIGIKKALTQEKELTSHAGIVWFATSVIGLCLVGNHGHCRIVQVQVTCRLFSVKYLFQEANIA